MAGVKGTGSVDPSHWRKGAGGGRHFRHGKNPLLAYEEGGVPHPPVIDPVDVLGIDLAHVHSSARDALERAVAEIAVLRGDLEKGRRRQEWLEARIFQDPWTGIDNMRALHRAMEHILSLPPESHVGGVFALFWLENHDWIHENYGLDGLHLAMEAMAQSVSDLVQETDVVTTVGGAGLGLLSFPAREPEASRAIAAIEARLDGMDVPRGGSHFPLRVCSGMHPVFPGDEPEAILRETDSGLRVRMALRGTKKA
ncbi:GGDEF domain-containing protein [Haematospirillum sp. H1815]|uniref:diguanylate cyclase domain-containing protein n=1 Tax=Haematospirillum sp. H1815 TaxID=2723108 RepID=UPI00143C30BA|nr:diguanylate cyclase [Haematospirillum sp. H1815]NKD76314.1 GGDEF domain-containing protein [Haematospirillum sp. H1815]